MTINAGVTEERLQAACQKLGSEAVVFKECMPKTSIEEAGPLEQTAIFVFVIVLLVLWVASFVGGLKSFWSMIVSSER